MYDIRSTVYNSINSNFIPNIYRRLVMKSIQQEYLYLLLLAFKRKKYRSVSIG